MTTQSAYKSVKDQKKALAAYDNILSNWPVPYENRMVTTSFGETYILVSGSPENKPLVLLHGGGGNSTMWIYNIASLSKHFQVYAIDIIGEAGKSAGTRPTFLTDEYSLWLKEVFDALDIEKAALCGASLGGTIAHQFALKFPQSVASLIMFAPPSLYKMNPMFLLRGMLSCILPISFFARNFLKYISSKGSQFSEPDIQAFVIQVRAYKPNMNKIPIITDQELIQLPAKTLIFIGQNEVIYNSDEVASRIHSIAPSVTISIVQEAKHMVFLDQPVFVNEKIIQFTS